MKDEEKKQNEDAEEAQKSGLAYAAGFALFSTVAVCLGVGWIIDRLTGKSPLFMVIGIILGSALGLYEFYKITKKITE